MFDAYQKKLKAMSEYFANGITCGSNVNGFYNLECVEGKCENCMRTPPFPNEHFEKSDVTFNQFILEEYEYKKKKGETKKSSRTVR